ncbi:PAS domain-containing protein [Methanomassiliicoccus luminyensis]|jgi:PAS domain S-box-containing protein|uniref:PAS domain-containing protein n=1 Tax=Methanomassiliicoccus luminyensis TaxID=1080712 RepID=UPI0003784D48|nr:PAS domain-containing protein [Methanomassiliicoccus luminyensis]
MDRNLLFEGMLSQSSSLDLAVDTDGRLLYVSPSMAKALGLSVDQLMGKLWGEVELPAEVKTPIEGCFKHVLEEKQSMTTRMGISGAIHPKHYECTISPIMDGNGNVGNIMASFQDVTELEEEREFSAQLDDALLQLQSSYDIDRAIPEVLTDMSKALGADIATITFRQDEYWSPKYLVGANDSPRDSIFLEEQLDLMKEISKQKSIFELNDFYAPGSVPDLDETWGVRALVAIPLHVRGDVFGVLTFAHRIPVPPYGVTRKNLIRKLGAALSLAFSEDRYIWSRDSDTINSHTPIGITTIGMAVLDGKSLRVKYANGTYNAIVPKRYRGIGILRMPPYYPASHTVEGDPETIIREVQASGEPFIHGCIQERIRNGVMTFWQVVLVPSGQSSDVTCLLIDVTDWERSSRKVARLITAIQEEQLQVRALLESVPVGAYLSNAEGHIMEISKVGPRIWGDNVPLPRNIEEYGDYNGWWPDTGERLKVDDWPIVRAVRKGETVIGAIINYQSFDGKGGTVINSAAPIRNRLGKVIGAVEIDHDITEMKNLERKLETAKAHLEAVISQMPAGVAISEGPSGKVTMGNTALGRIFPTGGRMPGSIEEYSMWGLLDPYDMSPLSPEEHPLARALLEKKTVSGEAVVRRANGKETTVLMSATPVVGPEEKTIGAVAIFTDISHQKDIEKNLEQQARDLAKFNADLQRFAYVASNDIRESLKSLTNYLNLLDKSSS